MANKTLFLDFDGVIATDASYKRRYHYIWSQMYPAIPFPQRRHAWRTFAEECKTIEGHWELVFDPEKCKLVQDLLDYTGADLVISSSWRNMFLMDEIVTFLSFNGIRTIPKGQTPSVGTMPYFHGRGWQIHRYCEANGITKEDIVIFEDLEDCEPFNGRVVRTKASGPREGLQYRHILQALRLWDITPP